jgi:hypothetical protein
MPVSQPITQHLWGLLCVQLCKHKALCLQEAGNHFGELHEAPDAAGDGPDAAIDLAPGLDEVHGGDGEIHEASANDDGQLAGRQFHGRRGHADAHAEVEGGSIAWHLTTNRFEARCNNTDHGERCRMTRASTEGKRASAVGQGRPLGTLVAWLASGGQFVTAYDHRANLPYDGDIRMAARSKLRESDDGLDLLSRERAKRLGEDSEPEDMP